MNILDTPNSVKLPLTQILEYFEPEGECVLEFRLIYKGPLKPESASSGSGNVKQKHAIRREFHRQLSELWKQHPNLRQQSETNYAVWEPAPNAIGFPEGFRHIVPVRRGETSAVAPKTWVEHIADDHIRLGYRFVPLVSKNGGFTCSLQVLFLRRDNPGHLIKHGERHRQPHQDTPGFADDARDDVEYRRAAARRRRPVFLPA